MMTIREQLDILKGEDLEKEYSPLLDSLDKKQRKT